MPKVSSSLPVKVPLILAAGLLALGQVIGLPKVLAQASPPVRNFEARELGGERQIWDIAQAPDGTIALATQAGLALFDGVRWRTLAVPRGHTLRTVIYREADSTWLAGGYDGWWQWSWRGQVNDRLLQNPQRVVPPGNLKEEWWHAFQAPGDDGAIWWQTFSRIMRQSSGGEVEPVKVPGNVLFARTVRDTLYLPVLSKGLYRRAGLGWTSVPGGEVFAREEIVGLVPSRKAGLLVATKSGTVTHLHAGKTQPWPEASPAPWRTSLNQFISLQDGRYAVATAGDGLYLLSAVGHVEAHLRAGRGLFDDAVLCLFEDQAGGLWIGQERGLTYLPALAGASVFGVELGPVYDYCPEATSASAFLASNRGLFRLDSTGDIVPVPNFTEQVWHVTPTPAGLVVGTNSSTLLFDPGSSRQDKISTLNGGWSWLTIDSFSALAGTYVGLEYYVREANGWRSVGKLRGWDRPCRQVMDWPGREAAFLLVDPQEGLWGFALDAQKLTVTVLKQLDTVPGWLIADAAGLHYRCADHVLDFGGDGSVTDSSSGWCYQPNSTQSTASAAGLSLCITSERLELQRASRAWLRLPLRANLSYPLLRTLNDGTLIVGLDRGLLTLQPNSIHPVLTAALATASRKQTGNSVEVELAQRRFGDAPRFRARLSGVDTGYTAWSATGNFAYAALRPGDYRLDWESDDGQQGQVKWEIPPPWTQSRWAFLLYGMAIAAGFWAIRNYYRRRLGAQQRQADLDRERQVNAERLRANNARLEDEVRVSQLQVALSQQELALRQNEVEQRNRELADATLTQARHNEALLQLREGLTALPKSGEVGKTRRHLHHILETSLDATEDWARFAEHFDAVHVGFLHRLHETYTDLTPGDLRLAALLRMNLASKEIAPLLHLSVRGVENKRYRLRKKLGLEGEENLTEWVLSF